MIEAEAYCPLQEKAVNAWLQERVEHKKHHAGLERLKPLFGPFIDSFKDNKIRIATIGGTNGKGETALRLGQYLMENGSSCATWMSPHILSLRERFLFQNRPIPYPQLKETIDQCRHLIPSLSFYQFHFYVFCHWVLKPPIPEFLILEVGMGGRRDAVNLFDADASAIASISRDHCEYLGNTLEAILIEKLGISRQGRPLITSLESPQLREVCRHHTHAAGVPWRDIFDGKRNYRQRNDLLARKLCGILTGDLPPEKPLKPLALRQEKMTYGTNNLLFTGAHNEDGFKKMVETLSAHDIDTILVSFSRREIPEILTCLNILQAWNNQIPIILAPFEHLRGLSCAGWQKLCTHSQLPDTVKIEYNWRNVIAEKRDPSQTILVCGSYYFLGEVQKFLAAPPPAPPPPELGQRDL